ncbi:hypothetical protein GWK47_003399 [Chionoecetes opilio]|uniref:Tesmin/TSO1-like CXC domain-containing protein n=1 Tax=Chionoecetes opilio TaxID=41210 RepID=A0A8J4YS90_CHIOP|nr:hypothetical protein GWK47_003399 [Chionoecetes opilio]
MFQADGQMRVATGKVTLKKNLQVEVLQRLITSPTSMVVDVSALLWTLEWPSQGTVDTFISVFKHQISSSQRYPGPSARTENSTAGSGRVLKNSANKKQLNTLLCDAILSDDNFLQHATQNHQLVVTGENDMPTQVSKGRKSPRLDLASTHEEADILITQQAIHLAKEDPESHVRVVCDDTDVFALLAYYYLNEKLQSSLTMQSPIMGRSCIDVKETARKHSAIVPEFLALHALTGLEHGWEADDTNKCLIPRNMEDGVSYAPEHILKLVRCGCTSERACRGGKCGCMGRQLPCTMFCTCGGGTACSNPFSITESATDHADIPDDSDEANYRAMDVDDEDDE